MHIDVEDYYRRYGPMVLRRCRYLLRDEDRALDAMQEVFVRLIRYRETLKGSYPSSLLYRMATNICLNMIRDEKKSAVVNDEEALAKIARYDDAEERILASDLLDRIFERELASTREIAVMYYIDGMTLGDVAQEAGLSVSGVRKRLRKLQASAANLASEEKPS
jgi:RNA polymerase sigma-70 factor (ECF subfamily)